jgi:hypothetical protein
MKATVFSSEKTLYNAILWYARKMSPPDTDARVEIINRKTTFFLNKKVYLSHVTVTPEHDGVVVECPNENCMVHFIDTAIIAYECR